jgi:hypothetical protein
LRGNSLLRSLLGVKRTWPFALHMSAFDPKRTFQSHPQLAAFGGYHAEASKCPLMTLADFHSLPLESAKRTKK